MLAPLHVFQHLELPVTQVGKDWILLSLTSRQGYNTQAKSRGQARRTAFLSQFFSLKKPNKPCKKQTARQRNDIKCRVPKQTTNSSRIVARMSRASDQSPEEAEGKQPRSKHSSPQRKISASSLKALHIAFPAFTSPSCFQSPVSLSGISSPGPASHGIRGRSFRPAAGLCSQQSQLPESPKPNGSPGFFFCMRTGKQVKFSQSYKTRFKETGMSRGGFQAKQAKICTGFEAAARCK